MVTSGPQGSSPPRALDEGKQEFGWNSHLYRALRRCQLIELSALVERLQRVMEPSYIPIWLRRPIEALDDRKPIDLLARGEYRRVARVAEPQRPRRRGREVIGVAGSVD